jgi:DNA-binding response OmpR family regulator
VGADEWKLSQRVFLLQTYGYKVLRAQSTAQALKQIELLAGSPMGNGVGLLLLHLPLLDVESTLREARKIEPEIRSVITSEGSGVERDSLADAYLPRGCWSSAELLEKIRILTVRKTGPKKKPVARTLPPFGSKSKRGAA